MPRRTERLESAGKPSAVYDPSVRLPAKLHVAIESSDRGCEELSAN
ncbi:MAG: hypothetical protein RLY14_62 [Planctomycetota bacterium]|jgi:hypothetical protein